jgi:poly(A)-specific ribonuclease
MAHVEQHQPSPQHPGSPTRPAAVGACDGESIMVNSTKSDFLEQSNDFIRHLPKASWIAIDEEMTGIQLPPGESKRLSKQDSPTDRYPTLKLVPERYSIIQFGICLFEHKSSGGTTNAQDAGVFHVRRYKFTLFPPDDKDISREITLSPSSIHFLLQNNMDLNLWAQEGIPFCTEDASTRLVDKFLKRHEEVENADKKAPPTPRRKIVLTKDDDKDFHAKVMSSLREWLDAPIPGASAPDGEGVSFLLPRCNSFLRRSIYEAIDRDYPYLILERHNNDQIRVWRCTDEEKARRNQRLLVEGYNKLIQQKIGAQRIFLALKKACNGEPIASRAEHVVLASDANEAVADFTPGKLISGRKIPLVVHNGLMDLLFLMTHFHSPKLPDNWDECKQLVHSCFPVIYDTKIMATDYSTTSGRTRLDDVYEQAIVSHPHWKSRVFSLDGQPQHDKQSHDAAYDAYMTGVAFCALSYAIQDQCKIPPVEVSSDFALWDYSSEDFSFSSSLYGRNKMYFHLSPYTIDFETPDSDPLGRGMSHLSTYIVANIDPSVSSRDIINCLSGLTDSGNQRVNFDVIWVDDTTFLVGAQIVSFRDDDERFEEHGGILLEALKNRFNTTETIELLRPVPKQVPNNIWNLWGFLGGNETTAEGTSEEEQRPRKRQRRA